jgi:hypothetical protein
MNSKTVNAVLAAIGCASIVVSAVAAATPINLPTSNLNTRPGRLTALRAGATYEASAFPLSLRFTSPDSAWSGTQWTTSSHGKRAFGWVAFGQGSTTAPPLGLVEIETAYGPTPSVATIVGRLRSAGGGANFGATTRVTFAGRPASQIDGRVYGRFGHAFVPFTPKTGGASPPDTYKLSPGEAFRLIVVDVQGKRVVLIFDSAALAADEFPTFLDSAGAFLRSLRLG